MLIDKHGNPMDLPLDMLKGALIENEHGAESFIRDFNLDRGGTLIMNIHECDIDTGEVDLEHTTGIPITGSDYRWRVLRLRVAPIPSK